MPRIHILGASGSGTTTLGATIAARLSIPHKDSDSFFWLPTNPPFTTRRPADQRLSLLLQELPPTESWVLSGSALGWATALKPLYDLNVYLHLDPALRMRRLRLREAARYGERILPEGDMAAASAEFLDWAASYDTAGHGQRSRAAHEAWLSSQAAPVLRLDSSAPVQELEAAVLAVL